MVSKGFPNVTTSGRQYNFGEKPSVILYTYINLHAGTPKPQSFLSKSPGLQCSIGSERELYKYTYPNLLLVFLNLLFLGTCIIFFSQVLDFFWVFFKYFVVIFLYLILG